MNWDLSVPWTRTTRTQTQIQEHKPKNYLKKKKKTNQSQKFRSQSQPTTTKIKPTTTQAKKINPQPQTNLNQKTAKNNNKRQEKQFLRSWWILLANLGSWILLWIFVVFLFFFVLAGFGWKRESKSGFVREKVWREKWVGGLECWVERRRWRSNSSEASVRNPEQPILEHQF